MYKNHIKRLLDILLSIVGLAITLPFYPVIAVAIKLDTSGPVFFHQARVGKGGKIFNIIKFRSMEEARIGGSQITASGDARVTRVGTILRKYKVDEIPQFINVLFGDMSIVGPRPEVPKYVKLFVDDYENILSVRPGITDIATLLYRDEEMVLGMVDDPDEYYTSVHLPRKISLSSYYVENVSFFLDLKLILLTVLSIFSGKQGSAFLRGFAEKAGK